MKPEPFGVRLIVATCLLVATPYLLACLLTPAYASGAKNDKRNHAHQGGDRFPIIESQFKTLAGPAERSAVVQLIRLMVQLSGIASRSPT